MVPPGVSTLRNAFSSLPSSFRTKPDRSWSTSSLSVPALAADCQPTVTPAPLTVASHLFPPSLSTVLPSLSIVPLPVSITTCYTNLTTPLLPTQMRPSRFHTQLPEAYSNPAPAIKPYPLHLTPAVSPLCPHCSAVDHLIQWHPENTVPCSNTTLSPADEDSIKDIMGHGWECSTLSTYAAGLLAFHVTCDDKGFYEAERMPASMDIILYFISVLTGAVTV